MGKYRLLKKTVVLAVALKAISIIAVVVTTGAVFGQQPRRLLLSSLPESPKPLEKLLAAGDVTFEVGPRVNAGDPRIIGETRYEISYRYKSQAKWQLVRDAQGARILLIDAAFSRVQWKPRHVIWLRDQPEAEDFWSNVVLMHELDHLRISTDPRVAKRFAELLRQRRVIRHPLQPGEVAGRELTDKLVEREARAVFDELTDLIAIRYRELDRETSHGRAPLPSNSNLYELLRPGVVVGMRQGAGSN
ncbi:MAG: hypothetical protein CMM01_21865 [Rhodopirellula sp.]|nr:hypothetical protein [Rhodopirellula sp.]